MVQVIIRSGGKFEGNAPVTINGTLQRFPIGEEFSATADQITAMEDAGIVVERTDEAGISDGDEITVTNSAGAGGQTATVTVSALDAVTAALPDTVAMVEDQDVVDGKTITVVDGAITTIV